MPEIPPEIIVAASAPLVIGGLLFGAGFKAWRRPTPPVWAGTLTPLAICAAFAIVMAALWAVWVFPPRDSIAAMFLVAIALIPLGAADVTGNWPAAVRWIAALGACVCSIYVVTGNARQTQWNAEEARFWLAGLSVGAFAIWVIVDLLISGTLGASGPLVLLAITALSAALFGLLHSFSMAFLAGSFVLVLLGAAGIGLSARGFSMKRGVSMVFVPLWTCMLVCAYRYGELEQWPGLLLATSPLAAALGYVPLTRRFKPAWRTLLCMTFAAIPPAIAITLAAIKFRESMGEGAYE